MINKPSWKLSVVGIAMLALLSVVACSTSKPPPDSTISELARLKATGVESANEELKRLESVGAVSANDGAPPDSIVDELARLKAAGVESANEELKRMQPASVAGSAAAGIGAVPSSATISEMSKLKEAGSKDAEQQLAIWNASVTDADQAITAAVVLARYSTSDDDQAQRRSDAAQYIAWQVERGDLSNEEALDLLHTIAPEFSIGQRKRAADRLMRISESNGGELTPSQRMQVANELTRIVTGHGIDASRRMDAARQMIALSNSGELNPENGSELMDAVAPELSVSQRREAFQHLSQELNRGGGWGPERTKRAAEEGYRLITGDKMQVEERASAGVEVTGEALKRYGGDSYDDESVDRATDLIGEAMFGDLTTDKASSILGWDD